MPPERIALIDLTDQTRNFTTTAMLVQKHPPKKSRSGTNNLQQLVLKNKERVQMKGVLFNRDIDLFHETLVEGKEYDITNPIIARISETFKTEQVYQMTINAATQISETQSAIELPSYLILLTKVGDCIGKHERIDIIGIVVHMHDKAIVRAKSSGIPYKIAQQHNYFMTEKNHVTAIQHIKKKFIADTGESSQQLQPRVSVQQLSEQQEQRSFVDNHIVDLQDKIFKIEMTTYMLGENTQQIRWKAKRIVEAQS
ncbi:Replication protein A 70 kDa DNA-binding subunit B [Bienertia sinuspersici]